MQGLAIGDSRFPRRFQNGGILGAGKGERRSKHEEGEKEVERS